jgi:thiol-disulfide isomerase/thioredoxin
VKTEPICGLTFSWADGRTGSTADYLGRVLAILIVSLDCPFCKQAMDRLHQLCHESNISHLALADRSRPGLDLNASNQVDFPRAFAALPEIYLGLAVPRGTWIKFPTLMLLDETARVTFFCNEKEKLVDEAFLKSVLPSGERLRGQE